MLHDPHGRQFRYLRLSVTEVCNFQCSYCLPDGYQCAQKEKPLSVEQITHLAKAFAGAGINKIRITGGEPALRKDLVEIIRACKQQVERVAITTNGYNLANQIERWHQAGLDALNVSIDSLDPAQFQLITGQNRLPQIMAGIDKALALGIPTKINAVLLNQLNHHQFDGYLDWIKTKPVSVRFIELMQTGDNQAYFERHHISALPLQQRLEAEGWQRQVKRKDAGPANEYWHPDYQGRIGLIMPYAKDFCASCNRLRVSAKGRLHLCLFAQQGHDLMPWINHSEQLAEQVQQLLGLKTATHDLHQGNSGATRHLAMLGG